MKKLIGRFLALLALLVFVGIGVLFFGASNSVMENIVDYFHVGEWWYYNYGLIKFIYCVIVFCGFILFMETKFGGEGVGMSEDDRDNGGRGQ